MPKKRKLINSDIDNEKEVKQVKLIDLSNKRVTRSSLNTKTESNIKIFENDLNKSKKSVNCSKYFTDEKKNLNSIYSDEKSDTISFNNNKSLENNKVKVKKKVLKKDTDLIKKNDLNKSRKKNKEGKYDTKNNLEKNSFTKIDENSNKIEKKLDDANVEDLLNLFEFDNGDKSKYSNKIIQNDSDENDDFEEVEEDHTNKTSLEDYNPDVCKEGVTIEIFHTIKGKKKNPNWLNDMIRQNINRQRRDICMNAHKVNVLICLSKCFFLNNLTKQSIFRYLAFSVDIMQGEKFKGTDVEFLKKFLKKFKKIFKFTYVENKSSLSTKKKDLFEFFDKKITFYPSIYILTFLILLRAYFLTNSIEINTRLCICFLPIDHRCENLLNKNSKVKTCLPSKKIISPKKKPIETKKPKKSLKSKSKLKKKSIGYSSDKLYENFSDASDDIDFKHKKNNKINNKKTEDEGFDKLNLKNIENIYEKDSKIELWLECYSDKESRYICFDPLNEIFDKAQEITKKFYTFSTYVLSFDVHNHLKDLSQKYFENFEYYSFQKQRSSNAWLKETYAFFRPEALSKIEIEEDKLFKEISLNRPLPNSLSDFKSHQLYILENHLLKYEVIYPPDTKPIGVFRKNKIFLRENVELVHSKEFWKRDARSVRKDEEPYKISTARPKWDKSSNDYIRNLVLNLYGYWQTVDYEPGEAVNGKIPRNEFGNVDLYKPCMLPKGTIHLKLKGLMRIANKLQIDCVPAVTGFDLKNATTIPVLDGYVVCLEHKDILIEAWNQEQELIKEREKDKYFKRVYGNWKRLVRSAQISKKIYDKYKENFNIE